MRRAATQLETLALVGLLEAGEGRLTAQTLTAAAQALVSPVGVADTVDPEEADFVRLARWTGRSSMDVLAAGERGT